MTTAIMPGCEPFAVTGNATGVLVLHGFTGNPSSMRPLAQRLADAGYTVSLPRLPGHGTSVEDMKTTSWADWSGAALAAYDELAATCERVAVVGLSMGGALTSFLGIHRPNVAALVMINPVVKPAIEIEAGVKELVAGGLEEFESIGSDIKKEGASELSYNATPLRQVLSLMENLYDVEANLSSISAPVLLLQSREDHVVTSDNGDALVAHVSGPIERVWLENSYHVATLDNDQPIVEEQTLSFLAGVLA
jgi:carboxylesterase